MAGGWLNRIAAALAALLALLCVAGRAEAQPQVAGQPLDVCVLRDSGDLDPAALARHPERFDCTTPQHRLGPGDFWVISPHLGLRSEEGRPLAVRTGSVWQQGVTLHVLYADGALRSASTDRRGVTPLIQLGAIVEQPIPAAQAPVERLLWHVRGAANVRGILLGARVTDARQSTRANLVLAAVYAGFAGLCVALILYNLALWGALRHRFQLHYCLMLAALLAYTFSSSGAMAWVFPEIANNDRIRFNYLAVGATGAAVLGFARSFFDPRVFAGWLGRYTAAVGAAVLGSGLLVFLAPSAAVRFADAVFTCAFLSLASAVVPVLWRAWRLRSDFLWLFAIGWGAPILAAIARIAGNLHLLPWSFWLDNSTLLSMVAEIMASALAIAYRIKLLRAERDEAIASEVMARRLADTDPLTGLLNRRAFLGQAIGRPGEQQLLVADLDHFKRINETLGHDGGDEVLRLFARLLRACVPPGTLVARLGGEEFAVLTPADTPIEPEAVLARLRAARMPFDLRVTASIGACRGPIATETDWKALYRGADAALFRAKSAGRDRAHDAMRAAA